MIKTEKQIEKIEKSGKILSAVLKSLKNAAKEGIDLISLDNMAHKQIKELGAKPAFLGYRPYGAKVPFPASICASVNEVVVHGVPKKYFLKSGDVLKIDIGVDWQGGITDAAVTVPIGKVTAKNLDLISTTKRALVEAIRAAKPGKTLGDIGFAIERTISNKGFHIIEGLTGHGVGIEIHEEPVIYNFGKPGAGIKLRPGMVLAIEPMTSISTGRIVQLPDDSFATADNSPSAHFEHTILITEKGSRVVTE
ncbi:MAG: type I methionyl aminopeptidase [Candidatus Colwellbacteria bacterium]|nr:type I methionyl aminopeptidase [Candidatus Colwellbacteria bacterium]